MHLIFKFLTISSFGFNRLSSKLVGMFFGIVPMQCIRIQGLILFRIASSRRYVRITRAYGRTARTRTHILAQICATITKQSRTKSLSPNIKTIPKNMPTNLSSNARTVQTLSQRARHGGHTAYQTAHAIL